MDLEVVGRHALFFDDDTAAAFVNSGDALVEWHSLQIDRYDVRHLLSVPPPSRGRNRSNKIIISDEPSLHSQLDTERYLDLHLKSDQSGIEEDEKPMEDGGYRAVAFSYGNSDDSANQTNTACGIESSEFLPPFVVPGDLLLSLPPTEKVHQIIARTAIFVSKHGGQSEIVLRVKQGDNPTFGFLMPGHHLHAYFRYLVDHPILLNSEFDRRSTNEAKKDGVNHSNGIEGSLSLLGSVYGSGEEEDDDESAETVKYVPPHNATVVNHTTLDSKIMESNADSNKDESVFCDLNPSNKEKFLAVKKNFSIPGSVPGSLKVIKKKEKCSSFSAALEKARSQSVELTSTVQPFILEPPPELKRLIEKLVEFIVRNGKHFEATLIEQDSKHGRFSFLLPTNIYHSYYLKVLQTAEESKANSQSSYSGKENVSIPEEQDDIPQGYDRREKFKMVIGKLKKELQEKESKVEQKGITVDAASAAAILQAATRGISTHTVIPTTSTISHGPNVSVITPETDSSEIPSTEKQKLKAERLKKAKMFVAMLKGGAAPLKTGTSRCSSMEPLEVNLKDKERDETHKNLDEDSERLSKRKYRSKSEIRDVEDDETEQDHRGSRKKHRSRSRRHDYDDEMEVTKEVEQKHYRRRHRSHEYSEAESDEDESSHKNYKSTSRSHHSRRKDSEYEDRERRPSKHSNEEDGESDKCSMKKHRSRHSSHHSREESSRNKHSKRRTDGSDDNEKEKELEEGEISSRVSNEFRETSADVVSSQQRASSQPAQVPDDLRAKVRAMLMATRL